MGQTESLRYWAFISYSHADARWASWLHRALERYSIPADARSQMKAPAATGRIAPVFLDRAELAASQDLNRDVGAALASSAALVVIASPAAARSSKVAEEIIAFKRMKPQRPVLCLIVAGRPSAVERGFSADEECFPIPLRHEVDSDGRLTVLSAEPLAADVRGERSRRGAIISLVAGIIGLPFDTLARRDMQRRNRRLVVAGSLALCGMLLTSGLAVAAWVARNEAVQQRHRAEAETKVAHNTEEFLASIFDASTPEKSLGRPISARDLLDVAAQRVKVELPDAPAIQARLNIRIGRAYRLLGAYDRARSLLESGVTYYQSSPHPDIADYSRALIELGDLYGQTDRLDDAQGELQHAVDLEASLPTAMRPIDALLALANLEVQRRNLTRAASLLQSAEDTSKSGGNIDRDTMNLQLRLGELYRIRGDYPAAISADLRALALAERLYGTLSTDKLVILNNLSLSYQEHYELAEAEKYIRQEIALAETVYGAEHPLVAIDLQNFAIIKAESGKLADAEPLFRRALAIREKALGPDSVQVAYSLDNLADCLVDQGDAASALPLVRRSQHIYETVEGDHHPDVAYALIAQAEILTRLQRTAEARPLATRALKINEDAYGATHPLVARALLHLARIDIADRKFTAATTGLERALTIADSHWQNFSGLHEFLEAYAQALRGAGDTSAANTVLQRLEQLRQSQEAKP